MKVHVYSTPIIAQSSVDNYSSNLLFANVSASLFVNKIFDKNRVNIPILVTQTDLILVGLGYNFLLPCFPAL